MKKCIKCNIVKSLMDFGKNKTTEDGLCFYCKKCKSILDRDHYLKNKDRILDTVNKYKQNNADKVLNCKKKEYEKNKQGYLNRARSYYENNKESVSKKAAIRFQQNKQRSNEYRRNKKIGDANYRLACNLRSRTSKAVKSGQKSGSAVRDLGCTIAEFKLYLESRFQPGMSWENYGRDGWHLDHIRPLVSFDLSKRDQFLMAAHFSNIQPLWHLDNLTKGGKYDI